jgi:hypothetical protein
MLMNPRATFTLALRLQNGTLTIGEAFSFMSGLYFRGKLAYAERFGRLPDRLASALVITPSAGLRPANAVVTAQELSAFAEVDVHEDDARYRGPLDRDLTALHTGLPPEARVVLLGSIATQKYVDALVALVGSRLHYPPSFIGRGDMSRGGLLLRAARAGVELEYAPLDPAVSRRGARPPKLEPPAPRQVRLVRLVRLGRQVRGTN